VKVTQQDLQDLLTPEAIGALTQGKKAELISEASKFYSTRLGETGGDMQGEPSELLPERVRLGDAPSSPSDLATSIFVCSRCPGPICRNGRQLKSIWFGWQGALRHSCLRNRMRISSPDAPGRMSFDPAAYSVAVTLVREAGLQPETATVEDMDNTGARWFCGSVQACRLSNELAFDWQSAVAHAMSFPHFSTPANFKKLTEYQLQHIELPFPSSPPQHWGCGHCEVHFLDGDNFEPVVAHLRNVHQIEHPVEGDDIIRFRDRHSFQPLPIELCKVPPEPQQSTHVS